MNKKNSKPDRLKKVLDAWDTRLRLKQSVTWLPRGLAVGLVLALGLALAARLWPILPRQNVLALSGLLALIGVVAALLGVWLWQRSPLQLARYFDQLFELKERLSTAVELVQGSLPIESRVLAARQYRQTLSEASKVSPWQRLAPRPDWREWVGALVVAVGLGAAIFAPNSQEAVLAQQAEIQEAITEQLSELERLREQVQDDPQLTDAERMAVTEVLDDAIQTLSQSGVTQQEALAALDAAARQLDNLSQQFADQRQEALQQASGLLDGTAAQDAADSLAQGDLLGAAEALKDIDPNNLTPQEQQELADALQAAAEALGGSNPDLADALSEAADALRNGDAAAAADALDQAAEAMADAAGTTSTQVDQYADQLDKGKAGLAGAGKGPGQANQPGQGSMGQAQPPSGGQGQGQGQAQGQGQGQGQVPGQGQTQGQGQGASGAGRGDGQGELPGGQVGGAMPTDNAPGDGGEAPYDPVYAPQRIGGEGGDQVDIPGDPGPGQPTGNTGEFADNPAGESTVPYNEVWADYAEAINQALEGGYIPLSLRDLIHQYFSGLAPD